MPNKATATPCNSAATRRCWPRAARVVVLEVPRDLLALMATLAGPAALLARGDALPPFDYHCPLMSLPLAFATTLASVPAPPSYLAADPARAAAWRRRLGPAADGKPRIGLAWRGNPVHKNDGRRSIGADQVAAFARWLDACCELVALQRDWREDEAALAQAGLLRDVADSLVDFADTAALVATLDLVITVDTSIAHLAGALGKPVWILLPALADWRWLDGRDDSPWYPSARLWRQRPGEAWPAVLARVVAALDAALDTCKASMP